MVAFLTVLMVTFGAMSVSAYTGYYSFEITNSVKGTNVHTLANVSTSTTATADTYDNTYAVSPTKFNYTVQLYKSFSTYYTTSQITADGYSYTKNYGVIASGDYTVNVTRTTSGYGGFIIGEGYISQ